MKKFFVAFIFICTLILLGASSINACSSEEKPCQASECGGFGGSYTCNSDEIYILIPGSSSTCCPKSWTKGCYFSSLCQISPTEEPDNTPVPTATPTNPPGCNAYSFISGSAPVLINPGATTAPTGAVKCNYGGQYDCIAPVVNAQNSNSPWTSCNVWDGFSGNDATFTCTAVTTPGSYTNICQTRTGTTGNCCTSSNNDGAVVIPTGIIVTRIPPTATNTPSPTNTPVPTATTAPGSPTATSVPLPALTIQAGCNLKQSGDANCDNVVNGTDFEIWNIEFLAPGYGAKTASFDLNQKVDLVDFEIWRSNFYLPN